MAVNVGQDQIHVLYLVFKVIGCNNILVTLNHHPVCAGILVGSKKYCRITLIQKF